MLSIASKLEQVSQAVGANDRGCPGDKLFLRWQQSVVWIDNKHPTELVWQKVGVF